MIEIHRDAFTASVGRALPDEVARRVFLRRRGVLVAERRRRFTTVANHAQATLELLPVDAREQAVGVEARRRYQIPREIDEDDDQPGALGLSNERRVPLEQIGELGDDVDENERRDVDGNEYDHLGVEPRATSTVMRESIWRVDKLSVAGGAVR